MSRSWCETEGPVPGHAIGHLCDAVQEHGRVTGWTAGLKWGGRVAATMSDFEYEALLQKAREGIPKEISERSRWTLPEPEILIEGSQTIIRNFSELVSVMDRDANHVYQFMLNELGTSGTREKHRVLFKGRIPPKRIKGRIVNYVRTYILCGQCNAPDTRFVKEGRTTLLKCQACGAKRPVRL